MKTTEYFDKIYVINLKRRTDRKDECLRELEANSIDMSKVEFFDAYDHPTSGHQGCTRSHRMLLRKVADSPESQVLILEDDFKVITLQDLFAKGFRQGTKVWDTFCTINHGAGTLDERFDKLVGFLPDKWDVVYLGAAYGEKPISRLNRHVIRCGFMQTTGSYGITKEFAQVWSDKLDREVGDVNYEGNPGQIDNIFGNISHEHLYYVFQPRLIYQRESKSDLTGRIENYLYSMTDNGHESQLDGGPI